MVCAELVGTTCSGGEPFLPAVAALQVVLVMAGNDYGVLDLSTRGE